RRDRGRSPRSRMYRCRRARASWAPGRKELLRTSRFHGPPDHHAQAAAMSPADGRGAPQVCVGAVVMHDGALLLVQRAHDPEAGSWSLPGGRVEPGEPLWEAVVREVREETSLDVA